MPTWMKWTLGGVGVLFTLKLINDSKKLAQAIHDKANTANPTSASIGGRLLPIPTAGSDENTPGVIAPSENNLGDSNPNVGYYSNVGHDFFGV